MARGRLSPRTHFNVGSVQVPEGYLNIGGTDVTSSAAELNILDGVTATATELNKVAGITGYPVQCAEVLFVEAGAAGVYTGSVSLPAGATLLDIIIYNTVLWTAGTSALMDVGDVADPNGFYNQINLKATDLLAAESISFAFPGGKGGADLDAIDVGGEGGSAASADVHVRRRYLSTARVISGVVTTVGTTATAGRTRMIVLWVAPGAQTTATKVAS